MSEEYINQILLEVNGKSITDFKSVTEGERELYNAVKLMNSTGHSKKLERPTVKVDYAIPSDTPEFDFTTVKGGTLTIDRQNGTRIKYTGVYATKIGEAKYDPDSECVVKTIDFSAKKRTET
jgi:hypothetical protein